MGRPLKKSVMLASPITPLQDSNLPIKKERIDLTFDPFRAIDLRKHSEFTAFKDDTSQCPSEQQWTTLASGKVSGLYSDLLELKLERTKCLDLFTMSCMNINKCRKQTVKGDCTVFMVMIIEYLNTGREFDFRQDDILIYGKRYAIDIFHHQLSL
ncbi:hypothetical protein FNV43_RR24524 [Rhamnella rubrinervis]|uniref:Ubiquitin-like protease family profile domain-containing protein n=1 Tax=Rhamnella rubrinervis TaxID=2594499 RepID=A0A8K0GLA6_9ROSA|nr:hypothetical protein FNV43_RR24524 [Rhamnella rubrinervis]